MKSPTIKERAIAYRKRGYSYAMIAERFQITKSTLSNWLKDIPFVPNKQVASRINAARRQLILQSQRRGLDAQKIRKRIHEEAKAKITRITQENLWHIGSALYLAEGLKKQRQVQITNSDPKVIQIAMRWLLIVCNVPIKNIMASIHLYPDIKEARAIRFWSEITKLPRSQFQKTIIDRRLKVSKFKHGILPFGTLKLRIRKGGVLFEKISGWIEGIVEKIS